MQTINSDFQPIIYFRNGIEMIKIEEVLQLL